MLSAAVTEPPVDSLLQLLGGFQLTQVLMTSHRLNVFNVLADEALSASEACDRLHLPRASGERLLEACAALKLLDHEEGTFKNSSLAETYLVSGRKRYLGGLLDYYQDVYLACSRLPVAVSENRPQVTQVSGGTTDVFTAMQKEKALASRFLEAMHSLGLLEGEKLASLYAFEKITCLLDVGGGSGALSMALADAYPHLKIQLFDRPLVCDLAQGYLNTGALSSRIECVPGDFWSDDWPQGADAILLSMILHDWDRPSNQKILQRCFTVLPSQGTLLIFEQLLNEDRCGPPVTCMTNLTMLLRTVSGAEYTASDYESMVKEAGFESVQVHRTSGLRHLITANKP